MPVVTPTGPDGTDYTADPLLLLALCVWREARGEIFAAKQGVSHTVLNRCKLAPAQGWTGDIPGNILKPWQFSSFMEGDANATKYPAPGDQSWEDSKLAAMQLSADPTMGAVFYFSPPLTAPPRAWGDVKHSATIGALQFYRLPIEAIP